MNKKIMTIVLVVALAAALLLGYNTFLAPKAVEGDKAVTITVTHADEGIDETFEYQTDQDFLLALMQDHQEELGATFEEFDFGIMVAGLMGYEANEGAQEYWHLIVNGQDAVTGPGEVPLTDGDVYDFELRTW